MIIPGPRATRDTVLDEIIRTEGCRPAIRRRRRFALPPALLSILSLIL